MECSGGVIMRIKTNDPKWLGMKFGRLTVIGFKHKGKKWYWECNCECGGKVVQQAYAIRNGHTLSCGCYQKERASEANLTHGQTETRLYRIYNGMKNRCYNEKQSNYRNYGARGIHICEKWLNNFQAFYDWAVSNGYADDLSIDRIDNTKGYSPDNCKWATRAEQQRNTTRNNLFTYAGRTQTITDWAKERGLNFHTVEHRIHRKGMSVKDALGL